MLPPPHGRNGHPADLFRFHVGKKWPDEPLTLGTLLSDLTHTKAVNWADGFSGKRLDRWPRHGPDPDPAPELRAR